MIIEFDDDSMKLLMISNEDAYDKMVNNCCQLRICEIANV